MDFELRVAREKLERDQKERKARAKAKLEKEKRAKAEAALQREALEVAQREKRLEEERARLEVNHKIPVCLILISFVELVNWVQLK
jgi:hypothetical protein